MIYPRLVCKRIFVLITAFLSLSTCAAARALADPPIPANTIRIHYFRPDGNYFGWTIYAFGDTTEPNNFGAGPVAVTGKDSFGAYFDVGITQGAQNVGLDIHNGNYKDPTTDLHADPAVTGDEYWILSGSNVLQTTQPPTIQQTDPPIPAGKLRIHYFKPNNNYGGWSLYPFFATTDAASYCGTEDYVTGYDTYGAYYDVGVDRSNASAQLGFIIHNCNTGVKDVFVNETMQVSQSEAWILSGDSTVFAQVPQTFYSTDPPIPAGHARIHYYRPDDDYAGWSVYTFGATDDNEGYYCGSPDGNVTTPSEKYIAGYDSYGAFFDVSYDASQGGGTLGFIIHNCSTGAKDPGPDQHLQVGQQPPQLESWVISGNATVFLTQPTASQLLNSLFGEAQAFWIDRSTVAIQSQYLESGWSYFLTGDPTASLQLTTTGVKGGTSLSLTVSSGGLTANELSRFPQLANYAVLHLPANAQVSMLATMLTGELALSAVDSTGTLRYATSVQDAGVLDDLFAYSGMLGVVIRRGSHHERWYDWPDDDIGDVKIKVWAPTAQSMKLQLFDQATDTTPSLVVPMHEHNGVWVARGDRNWINKYYLLDLKVYVPVQQQIVENSVTDPYSIDLALNGTKSRISDLEDRATEPAGWDQDHAPFLADKSDLSIYELHIRDFSENDATVPAAYRGTYLAFANSNTNGMRHLRAIADAGVKAIHLLPSFHFASVNEDKSTWLTTGNLSGDPPDGTQQQAAVAAIQRSDGFNWGYDPVHYQTPEGAYAYDPSDRVREYRTMVEALHRAGLRVVQDVVFNHTSANGESPNSVLDEVVPNYYYRLDANGALETGSCCPDTASEHKMMEKLMIDTLVLNATEYKIDGFRFDIMSFHFTYNMQHIQQALAKLTPEKDGVDGSKIYLYGEGFNFGDTANNSLGPNADQVNLYGFGIGTFNDRIRDGIRGGSPFTDERVQGFATGLATDSSDYTNQNTAQSDQLNTLGEYTDWIKVGLTGNLRDYTLVDHTGTTVTGAQVNYNGQPTGYTANPLEAVNYCSVHDNQALFDAVQLKSAYADTATTRTRRQVVAMSTIALGEGVPFFLAGDDLLRSKDMDQNSYDSGDWFNKLDFSYQTDNWGIGLPIASQNQGQWPIMQPLLANAAYTPSTADIAHSRDAFREFMKIRYSSGLFRMQTFNEVQANLHFLNTGQQETPGVITMRLDANSGNYGRFGHIVVVFNASNAQVTVQDDSLKGLNLHLHPVQRFSSDSVVRQVSVNDGTGSVTVPALTTVVFVSE